MGEGRVECSGEICRCEGGERECLPVLDSIRARFVSLISCGWLWGRFTPESTGDVTLPSLTLLVPVRGDESL